MSTVPQDSLTAKLVKANSNTKKLCEFFAARREWNFPPEADAILHDLTVAASEVAEEVGALMARCGASSAVARVSDIERFGPGSHDPVRLQKFLRFLRELRIWFTAQPGPPTQSDGIAALRRIDGHANALTSLLADALERQAERPSTPAAAAPDVSAAEPKAPPDPPPTPPAEPTVPQFGKCPSQLVLDHSEATPMVQVFQNREELTPECEQLADAFLTAWDLELSYFQRKKLLDRILRWITSAPEGQVLVIKMKTISEPYEPYPSYVARELLHQANAAGDD